MIGYGILPQFDGTFGPSGSWLRALFVGVIEHMSAEQRHYKGSDLDLPFLSLSIFLIRIVGSFQT